MNEPAGEPHYQPPKAVLRARSAQGPVGVLRALLAAVGGVCLDVLGTNVLSAVLVFAFYALVPMGEFSGMAFGDWVGSMQNPWAVADLFLSSAMSVLGGYVAARFAYGREGLAFGALACMHLFYYSFPPGPLAVAAILDDLVVITQITALNWGSTLFGMWLRRREVRSTSQSGDSA